MKIATVRWENGKVVLLDQTLLPEREEYLVCETPQQVVEAIRRLSVRGAPAIGVAAAYGAALAAQRIETEEPAVFRQVMSRAFAQLKEARPTAVNLPWALDRLTAVLAAHGGGRPVADLRAALLDEARRIEAEDAAACLALGRYGIELMPDEGTVLTHCNAGALATAGQGTALSVIYAAVAAGKRLHVFADETRPLLQGARLTAWDCRQMGIPVTVLCDNAAGWALAQGRVDRIIVGADRIARNGDVANKIGTYPLAVLAREHGVPFYVAAPTSTLDRALGSGGEIPIEERAAEEVLAFRGYPVTPQGVSAFNPAFDVTPSSLVAAIVTEAGIARPPYDASLAALAEGGP